MKTTEKKSIAKPKIGDSKKYIGTKAYSESISQLNKSLIIKNTKGRILADIKDECVELSFPDEHGNTQRTITTSLQYGIIPKLLELINSPAVLGDNVY